jgi:hypothetical protein
MSWPLREFVGRPRQAELLETAPEGVGMEPEEDRRAARPFDDPVGLPEDGEDVGSLDVVQREP